MAKISLRWRDYDKFSFLWGPEFVVVHANHESGLFSVVTEHPRTITNIYKWLYNSRDFIAEAGEEYASDRD